MRTAELKRAIKALGGRLLLASGRYQGLFGDSAIIVAFHRIDDRYPQDPISYTADGFRAFCRLFKSHFQVVPLAELLDDLEASRQLGGKLVITFDDGYLDNYTVAAPILSDFGLPATFFIATGFIGSDLVSWWDEAAGIRSEWMNWEQVGELRRGGFDIGAHTINHADLGVLDKAQARAELVGSRDELERRLGEPVSLFAYPYGRPEQLSEENRALVRELGFRCAPSCYGGRVHSADDPYRLKRQPISPWFTSPSQFAWEMLRD